MRITTRSTYAAVILVSATSVMNACSGPHPMATGKNPNPWDSGTPGSLVGLTIAAPTANPYYSNQSSLTLSGACDTNTTVGITDGSGNGQSTACASGAYSFSLNEGADGAYAFTLAEQDAAGNTSASPLSFVWNLDTVAPAAPVVTAPSASGSYSSNSNSIVISGSCENAANVVMTGADSQSSVCVSAAFSFTVNESTDGAYVYSLSQTDQAGNVSSATGFTWNRSSSIPSTPVITIPTLNPFYSNTNSITISGTCSSGDQVSLGGDDSQSVACAGGAFSFTTSAQLADGPYNYSVTQTDAFSNTSAAATQQWIRDTVAPTVPTIVSPASNPYTSGNTNQVVSGGCENNATVSWSGSAAGSVVCASGAYSLTITENTDAGYAVTILQTDRAGNASPSVVFNWTRDTSTPPTPTITSPSPNPYYSNGSSIALAGACNTGDTVTLTGISSGEVSGGSLTQICAGGAYSYTINEASDATYVVGVYQTNLSSINSASASLSWTRDTVAPSAPAITSPTGTGSYSSNGNSILLAGTCETSDAVNLTGDSTQSVTCASNAYSFTINEGADGTYNFSVAQTDLAGNASSASAYAWTRSTAAPSTPVITVPAASPIYTNGSSLAISGTCTSGDTVNLTGDDVQSTACAGGAFSFTVNEASDTTYNFAVAQVDAFNNTSAAASQQWVRDTVAPSAPTITSPNGSGSYSSNSSSISLGGACENAATVNLTGDSTQSVVCSGGAYGFTVNEASDGTYHFSVAQTDLASNVSGSTAYTWSRSTATPPTPVITSPASSPIYTNGSSLTISGTCVSGDGVSLAGDSVQATACASSAFSFSVPEAADGTYNFNVTQTDAFNNTSAAASQQWVRDTVAPGAPTIASPTGSGSYSSNGSSISLGGACENAATVNLTGDSTQSVVCASNAYSFTINESSDGTYHFSVAQTDRANNASGSTAYTWTRSTSVPSTPTITAPAASPVYTNGSSLTISGACVTGDTVNLSGSATGSTACSGGAYSFNPAEATDNTYTFSITQTDAFNNTSAAASQQWVRDTIAPSAPTITNPTGTGSYASNGNSITLSGVCETAATVNLTGDSTQATACAASAYSFTISESTDNTYHFSVAQTDPAGNASGSTAYTWTRDTAAPPTPVVTSPAASPTYTNGSSLVISGTCVTGDTINMTGSSTGSTPCSGGLFSFTVNKASDNTYSFSFTQTDTYSNTSAAVQQQWVRDTVAPAAPTITNPPNPYDSADTTLAVTGGCENNATVSWTGDATGSMTCSSLAFNFSITENVDGPYAVTIKQTDRAGNVSSSTVFNWTRDTTIPNTPSITSPGASPYYSNGSSITLSGACDTGDTVTLTGVTGAEVTGGSLTYNCVGTTYSYQINESADATYALGVYQTDAASNDSATANFSWIRDTVAPTKPTITTPAVNPYTSSGSLTLSGACENNATVNLTGDSTQSVTCAGSAYSFSFNPGVDATYNFTVAQTDRAGNVSPSNTQQWVRDSTAPATPTITTPASTPYLSNDNDLTLSGVCETGDTVHLGGNVVAGDVLSPAGSLTETCVGASFSFDILKADGTYTFNVYQVDPANNTSGTASLDWTRDTVAPVTTITANPPSTNLSQNGSFSFTVADASGTITECNLDGAGYSTCTSPDALTGLSNGSHTMLIRSTDDAGNVETSPPSYTWTQAAYKTIALYHFDSSGAMTDSSLYTGGYNNGLTNSSSTNSATSKFAQAEAFSGTAQYAYVANTATQALLTTTMTVDVWVRVAALPTSTGMAIVSKNGASSGNYGWEFGVSKSSSSYYMYIKGCVTATGCTTAPALKKSSTKMTGFAINTWYHLAMTYNNGATAFYFNGAADGTVSLGTSKPLYVPTSQNMQVGRTGTGSAYLNGILDELRISQIVRWTSAFTPPTSAYTAD